MGRHVAMGHRQEAAAREGLYASDMTTRAKIENDVDHRQPGSDDGNIIMRTDTIQGRRTPGNGHAPIQVVASEAGVDRKGLWQVAYAERHAVHLEPAAISGAELDGVLADREL